jgi:hypothetical protein
MNDDGDSTRFSLLKTILDQSPSGGTPLCFHIREVIAEIRRMEPQLRATGQKACVIIATDGESSDGDIITAMQPLRSLPVWVVSDPRGCFLSYCYIEVLREKFAPHCCCQASPQSASLWLLVVLHLVQFDPA